MKNKPLIFGVILLMSIFIISAFILAKPGTSVSATNSDSNSRVTIPAHAVEVAPNVFSLGESIDVDGRVVQGYMFVDYRKGFGHKPKHNPGGGGGVETSSCFSFLANGAKWKTLEPWIVNPSNSEGLTDSFVFNNIAADIQKWEDSSSTDILGSGSLTTDTLVADTSSPDNKNEVYFADISSEGAIAVTIVWGIFRGRPSQRRLVEWDQIYDDVDFAWSASGEAGKMDFENIATHELGHSLGMGHPPSECTEETMYAFASFGETKKRDLHTGDIAGISDLY